MSETVYLSDEGDTMGVPMENIRFIHTDGKDEMFHHFYIVTEEYYSSIVGGKKNREGFIPYNISETIQDVILAYIGKKCVGCAGIKLYSENDAEIKRVWVEPDYRGKKIASQMIAALEGIALEKGCRRMILQTRGIMRDAVGLYKKLGYVQIPNYPPYDKLDGAVCYAKNIS